MVAGTYDVIFQLLSNGVPQFHLRCELHQLAHAEEVVQSVVLEDVARLLPVCPQGFQVVGLVQLADPITGADLACHALCSVGEIKCNWKNTVEI